MLNMMGEITSRFGEMTNIVGDLTQTINSQSQFIAKLEAQVKLIADIINREEEELQSQPVANPDEDYMVDDSTSCHTQAITTLRSGEVVENHVGERTKEQFEAPLDLHREKGKEVRTEASSPSPPIPEVPYEPRAPVIVHDFLPDEKLFENTQRNLPRYAEIQNYLSIGKIHSLWSKRRKDWHFKFKLKGQRKLSASRMWISLIWRIPYILTR
jgi:hypothetical protein